MTETVITGSELARELGVGPTALHRYCRTAGVPGCGSGNRYHLTADEADAVRLVAALAGLERLRATLVGQIRSTLATGARPPAALFASRVRGIGRVDLEVTARRRLRDDEAPRPLLEALDGLAAVR